MLVAVAASASAQDSPAEKQRKPEQPLVRLNLMVADEKGRTVGDVKQEELRLLVDGAEKPIAYFAQESLPVSYGLVIDNSGSLKDQIRYVVAAAKLVVENGAREDEAFVVRFVSSDNIRVIENFTSDKAALNKALDDMSVEGGQTALLDAVYLSGDYLLKKGRSGGGARRRALVLITDGEDRASYYKFEQVSKLLKGSDVQVFCIGLTAALNKERGFITPSKRESAGALLKRLATETGGRVFFAEKVGELQEAIGEVISNLHTQYVVGYAAEPEAGGKAHHKIEVKVVGLPGRGKLKPIVRPEYDAAVQVEAQEKKKGQ